MSPPFRICRKALNDVQIIKHDHSATKLYHTME
nr:MAG TPA: phosphatidylinositol-4-OH kinase-like protein [Caudoviricetes sp.]